VSILQQPNSLAVPIGRIATFSVTASGDQPLSYQWSKDGAAISGAISASYDVSVSGLGKDGSTSLGSYTVTVTNKFGTVVSNPATLTAGPRAPAIGDLRYLQWEQVTVPGLGNYSGVATNIYSNSEVSKTNAVGTPLGMGSSWVYSGPHACGWTFDITYLPPSMTGLSVFYRAGDYSSFQSNLQSIAQSNVVITSLDLESPCSTYGMSWMQTNISSGFDSRLEVVPASEIASKVAADGANGRVVTAASFDASGQANLISAGWQGDTSSVYETETAIATPGTVATLGAKFAAQGYVITAFGGNDTDGYMLIGMRVKGDALPRPAWITQGMTTTPAQNPDNAYSTTVVQFQNTIVAEQ
jgi:hypothetical protein